MRCVAVLLAAAVAGAAVWVALLSWGEHTSHYPAQVAATVACLALAGVALRLWCGERCRMAPPVGLALGFCAAWTVGAARTDETGLFIVGLILLLPGTLAGTVIVDRLTAAVLRRR